VIDRDSLEAWEKNGSKSTWDRAKERVDSLLTQYQPSQMPDDLKTELRQITTKTANAAGIKNLPLLPRD
jgi:trimethylamine:corrinoid methyltransferase-like protein